MEEYLFKRFMTNNNKKYWHYCTQWIENLTEEQILYFKEERKRLALRGNI